MIYFQIKKYISGIFLKLVLYTFNEKLKAEINKASVSQDEKTE
ncbi:hypothetical protein KL86DYS1_11530 [uncultured Dysgonomonas sp.]|uniref:Uncharacterized protein n=1 Tax=uncultured Dysgonomonas sp. TaxID=206096 RepID=A0A212J9S6_9BACT|nr:hypothetical protein KL86DYS1_11530 [uncultured Dysgonomonas sp.]